MKLTDIALLNLRRRKAKAAFVLLGLMIGVATLVGLVGLSTALTEAVNHKLEKYGANILITPRSQSLSLNYGGLSLGGFSFKTQEIKQADLKGIESIKNAANVAAVGPMVLGAVTVKGREALVAGIDFSTTRYLKPWWKLSGKVPGMGQVALGTEAARLLRLKIGDRVDLKGRAYQVSGLLAPTGSQDDSLLFMPLSAAQELLGKQGLVSMVEVAALCKDCPVEDMVGQIGKVLPGAKVTAIQSVVKGRMETIKHFKNFALGVSALVALVGALVVLVTMLGSVRERTHEIGIFRAIGFRRGHVAKVVLLEAFIISAAAGVLGWALGLAGGRAALPLFSEGAGAAFHVSPALAGAAIGLSLVLGLAASLYPAMAAARLDPHDALRAL